MLSKTEAKNFPEQSLDERILEMAQAKAKLDIGVVDIKDHKSRTVPKGGEGS